VALSAFLYAAKKKQKIPTKIRLYIIDKNKHYFVNNGTVKNGFSHKLSVMKNRDSVLSAFSKMAFLFDEIIRLRIVQQSNKQDSSELLYLLNLVPVNRKIRAFLDWGVFSPEYTRDMSRLFEVRNDVIHCVSLDEITYNPKNPISLSSASGFKKFKIDLNLSWNNLLKIYVIEQEKINGSNLISELNS